MIVSFLCLIGPGAVTCLLRARGVHEGAGGNRGCAEPGSLGAHRRHAPVIFILLEVLAYAVIHMAITTILLYPSGEAEIVVLPNGMPAVRYGPAALLLSVMLAAAAGLWGQPVRALKAKGRGKRIVMYAAAAAAAVGLLVFPAGSSPAEFQSCTVPVKLNHAFCGDTELLRVSGGEEPEYFIALHTLSKGLGLDCGVEQAGLFRIRYYLGNTVFSVNRMTPDRNYCLRGKELFISLACLRGDEPFLDIRVQDEPVLADGSSREIIYIEYDPKRFDPGWAIDGTDAADGSVEGAADGIITVSPVQNFAQDDNHGDFAQDDDHGDFAQDRNDGTRVYVMDLQNMTDARLKKSVRLLESFPDAYLLLEVRNQNNAQTEKWLRLCVQTAEKGASKAADRMIPIVSGETAFETVMGVYHWKDVVYDLRDLEQVSERDMVEFLYRQGIRTVAGDFKNTKGLLAHELLERGIKIVRFCGRNLSGKG